MTTHIAAMSFVITHRADENAYGVRLYDERCQNRNCDRPIVSVMEFWSSGFVTTEGLPPVHGMSEKRICVFDMYISFLGATMNNAFVTTTINIFWVRLV
jgi:hypothetical protein